MAERQYTTRRNMLKALPLAAGIPLIPEVAQAAFNEDPIIPLYQQWVQARKEWYVLSELPEHEDWNTPEICALQDLEDKAFWAMIDMTPSSMEGIAALVHVLWDLEGPAALPEFENYPEQANEPKCKLMRGLWRASVGRDELPPDAQMRPPS